MAAPVVLSIAGSDSGAGAGIQADLKTFSALGVYGTCAVTAITAQNTKSFSCSYSLPPSIVVAQIRSVVEDFQVRVVKLGMLATVDILRAVYSELAGANFQSIVVDPVMRSKTGACLLEERAVEELRRDLLPMTTICTPNVEEAATILEIAENEVIADTKAACQAFFSLGVKAVVLKGGHMGGGNSDDFFYDGKIFERLSSTREETLNTHGSGCSFASAIAAYLANGYEVLDAVRAAKQFITSLIKASVYFEVGSGHGPMKHYHRYNDYSDCER
ncbi:MAG: bifunctional hydroxymethylpyrimidine kinase/phosphomethylpyrimidine kinase [Deltaproteobacteria bacterium]|nr:bifunctional hydroxymethylpyrimidine kinase/phosphomethylpyrimidine kinase [Deltaproteobacteria bacterium]